MSVPDHTPPSPARPIEILLVDDEPGDVALTREAFENSKLINTLHVASDGEQAMAFLRREGAWAAAPRPDLILLDLNMPRMGGRELLAELKADPSLAEIPVAIVTVHDVEGEILKAYNIGVNCYITKPISVTKLMIAVCSIPQFHVAVVTAVPAV